VLTRFGANSVRQFSALSWYRFERDLRSEPGFTRQARLYVEGPICVAATVAVTNDRMHLSRGCMREDKLAMIE
jgi:hypothetical protein